MEFQSFEEMLEYDVNVKDAIIAEEVNQVMQTVYFPTAADQRMVVIVKVWEILERLHHLRFGGSCEELGF